MVGCRPYSTSYKSADIGANQLAWRQKIWREHQTAWNVPTENTESYWNVALAIHRLRLAGPNHRLPLPPSTTMAAVCQSCLCFQCVTTSEIGIVERCGKYKRLAPPGLRLVCWPLETVAGRCVRIGLDSKTINLNFLHRRGVLAEGSSSWT